MKKLTLFFLIFLFGTMQAQYQRFIYEYQFALDSTRVDSTETELMYLDIAPKGSKFYSRIVYENDSIRKAELSKQLKMTGEIKLSPPERAGKIRSVVEKSYPNYNVEFIDRVGMNWLIVNDTRPMDWKILSDKERIGEFNVQKATLNLYGRKWTAWFDASVPIQDGPYKFHGLPGLIVKISSDDGTHVFELKGVQKLSKNQEWTSVMESGRSRNIVKLDPQKYKKLFLENRDDPTKDMRQMMSERSVSIEMRDASGNPMEIEDMLRKREQRAKEKNARENNFLEKDLLK